MYEYKCYQGKSAIWFYAVMFLCPATPLYFMIKEGSNVFQILLLILMLILDMMFAFTIIRNKAELFEDHLVYTYGFQKTKIAYQKIHSIKRTHSPIASSANSLDRMYIDAKHTELYLALKENDAFLTDLQNRIDATTSTR